MLKCVHEYCKKWRCEANTKKRGVMIVGDVDDGQEKDVPYHLNGEVDAHGTDDQYVPTYVGSINPCVAAFSRACIGWSAGH